MHYLLIYISLKKKPAFELSAHGSTMQKTSMNISIKILLYPLMLKLLAGKEQVSIFHCVMTMPNNPLHYWSEKPLYLFNNHLRYLQSNKNTPNILVPL